MTKFLKLLLILTTLSGCSTVQAPPPGVWTPVPQAAPPPFVPVEDMDRVYPQKPVDQVDPIIVLEILTLILAADLISGADAPSKKKDPPQ